MSVRPCVRVILTFLQHALRYQFETWYIHAVGGTTCRVELHHNWVTLTYFTANNKSKSFICIHGFKKSYRGLRFGTHTNIVSVLIPTGFRHGCAIFLPSGGQEHLKGGVLLEFPHITGVSIVYSTVCSGANQRKHQSSTSLTFMGGGGGGGGGGMHQWPMNSPHKGPVTRKLFPFDDFIMPLRSPDSF